MLFWFLLLKIVLFNCHERIIKGNCSLKNTYIEFQFISDNNITETQLYYFAKDNSKNKLKYNKIKSKYEVKLKNTQAYVSSYNEKSDLRIYTHILNMIYNELEISLIINCVCDSIDCKVSTRIYDYLLDDLSNSYIVEGELIHINRQLNLNINKSANFVFETFGPSNYYIIPWKCLSYIDDSLIQIIVYNGCPINDEVELNYFKSDKNYKYSEKLKLQHNYVKGYLIFELSSNTPKVLYNYNLDNSRYYRISCTMAVTNKLISQEDLCRVENNVTEKKLIENNFDTNLKSNFDEAYNISQNNEVLNDKINIGSSRGQKDYKVKNEYNLRRLNEKVNFNSSYSYTTTEEEYLNYIKSQLNEIPLEYHIKGFYTNNDKNKKQEKMNATFSSIIDFEPEIIYDKWSVLVGRNNAERLTKINLKNSELFDTKNRLDMKNREIQHGLKYKDILEYKAYSNLGDDRYGTKVKVNDYGAYVLRDNRQNAAGVEIYTPEVKIGTLANLLDRDYGVKFNFKNKEIGIKHDFDQHIYKNPNKMATEGFINWNNTFLNFGSDIGGNKYSAGVGIGHVFATSLIDIDNRYLEMTTAIPDLHGKPKWKVHIQSDFPDQDSKALKGLVNISNNKRWNFLAGAGIGNDGIPDIQARVASKNFGVKLGLIGSDEQKRKLAFGVSLGKFTYSWNSTLDLTKIPIPLLFGLNPNLADILKPLKIQ